MLGMSLPTSSSSSNSSYSSDLDSSDLFSFSVSFFTCLVVSSSIFDPSTKVLIPMGWGYPNFA